MARLPDFAAADTRGEKMRVVIDGGTMPKWNRDVTVDFQDESDAGQPTP